MTSGIKAWSTTAASNNASPPNGAPEGWAPSTVNAVVRQIMAEVRTWYEDPAWIDYGYTYTYVATTQFKISGSNQTAKYAVGRRVRAQGTLTGTIYGTISVSAFSTDTTVTIIWDSGTLSSETLTISVGLPSLGSPVVGTNPTGTIIAFGGTTAPPGYLNCDASAVSRTTYAALFTAIGTTWGVGNGTTTFNLPPARVVLVGSGGSGTATLANTVGSTGGEETHALTSAENAAHTHDGSGLSAASDGAHTHVENIDGGSVTTVGDHIVGTASAGTGRASASSTASGGSHTHTISGSTGSSGSGTAHNIMQPSAVVLMCIKT